MATNNSVNLKTSGVVTYDGAATFSASTLTQNSSLIGGASNAITSLGVATNGQLVIGSSGVIPVLATLTAGTGIAVTNAAGSITIDSIGGGMSWVDVTGTTQAMAIHTSYTANNAGLVTLTLPATSAYGSTVTVCGKGAGGWKIAQNAGNTIIMGSSTSTPGVGGSVASTNQYDVITLVCTVLDSVWTAQSSIGNLTIV